MTAASDWRRAWDRMLEAVGTDFSDGSIRWGADSVESGTLRRYLEPLELASALHHDRDVARALGYDDITVPYTAALAWSTPALWSPGEDPLYVNPARDGQPARSPINNPDPGPAPPTQGYFATDMELDFQRPVVVGERVGTRGRRLVACEVKETSVGRGAFLTYETELVSDRGDVVLRMRSSAYAYEPRPVSENAR